MSKIQIFESNSQLNLKYMKIIDCCFRCQRYKFLKAIHNSFPIALSGTKLFSMSKIQIFESNSQPNFRCFRLQLVVFDVKDTNFWKQFTTTTTMGIRAGLLFSMSKIQIFESNSQRVARNTLDDYVVFDVKDTNFWKQFTTTNFGTLTPIRCFRCQRYKFLKAIHNKWKPSHHIKRLFSMSKIQIFESNSQHLFIPYPNNVCCFRCQRYKFLKAIHNIQWGHLPHGTVVFDVKDTNFWKQFTTTCSIFVSFARCFRCQRYKFLKAIHNKKFCIIFL